MAKRPDLFIFIRRTMYIAVMCSPHLEQQLPKEFKNLGVILEWIIEIFFYFIAVHIAILYVCTIYLNYEEGDLELLVNCLMQLIIYLWTILMKLYFRRLQKNKLEDLIDFINFNYKTRSADGLSYVTMDGCYYMANKWLKLYVYSCFVCAICWFMVPLAYGDRTLPLTCWYPFDYKKPIIYEILYFLQCLAQIQVAAAFSSSSGFHMVLSILLSGQYDILCCSLKNVIATATIKRKVSRKKFSEYQKRRQVETTETNEYYCSREVFSHKNALIYGDSEEEQLSFQNHYRRAFKACIQHHYFIIKSLNKMETFYNPIWFLKTQEVILLMCLVAFVSVKNTTADSFMKILSLAQYLLMVALEFLVICYFGEVIFLNSQRCFNAILRCPWYLHMSEIKNDFLIFLQINKNPFQLTAGKIYVLNLQCFKAIMTTAFSFLTFLQSIDERKG